MTHLPATLNQPPDYHWTPTNQRAFLEHLAVVGSVTLAAKHVGMSARAAYDLKLRENGVPFRLGWAAAVLIARERLGDDLLERAIHGYDEEYVRTPPDENGEVRIRRHRTDSRLGMEYLKRLDRMADNIAENAGELQLAQVIMSDWEAFLDRISPAEGGEGGNAAVACWLAGRDNRFNPLAGLWEKPDEDCEVAQIPADFADEPEGETDPFEAAEAMSVWYCEERGEWRTDFPPPDDFTDDERGVFGEEGYDRSLTEVENRIQYAVQAAALKPLRDAAEIARDRWFSGVGADEARAELVKEALEEEARLKRRIAEREAREVETKAALVPPALVAPEPKSEPEPAPQPDPNIRTIHCEPPVNYAARGIIPPWAQRI